MRALCEAPHQNQQPPNRGGSEENEDDEDELEEEAQNEEDEEVASQEAADSAIRSVLLWHMRLAALLGADVDGNEGSSIDLESALCAPLVALQQLHRQAVRSEHTLRANCSFWCCVCVTSPYPLRCSRAARGHPAAAGGRGAARRPTRRGPRATPPGSWWWQAGFPSSAELVPAVDQP